MEGVYWGPPEAYAAGEAPTWLEHRSPHFVFHFLSDSNTAYAIELIAARLETVRDATAGALHRREDDDTAIEVFLTDADDLPRLDQAPEPPLPVGPALRVTCPPDAPGEGVERALVELMLLGERPAEPLGGAAFAVDGLLGCVSRGSLEQAAADARVALVARRRQGESIGLADVVTLSPPADPARYRQLATSFVAFLLGGYGPTRFRRFAQAARSGEPAAAAEAIYRKALPVLEKEWLAGLQDRRLHLIGLGGLFARTLGLLRPHPWLALLCLLAMTPFVAYRALQPLIFKSMIDDGLAAGRGAVVTQLIFILVGLTVAKAVGLVLRDYLVAWLDATVMNALRLRVLGHLQRLSHEFYARAQVGDLLANFSTDLRAVEQGIGFVLPVAVQYALVGLVAIALLFTQQAMLALIVLLALPIFYLGFRFVGPRAEQASLQRQEAAARALSTVHEYIAGHAVVEAFGLDEQILGRVRDELARLARSTVRVGLFGGVLELTTTGGGAALTTLTLSVGALLVLRGELSLGALVALVGLVGQLTSSLEWLAKLVEPAEQASGALQRLNRVLAERPEVADAPEARIMPRTWREITFENVTFSYTGAQVNLNNLNTRIPAGQRLAIVGRSGCGKSTVINLLLRFYDPTVGAIAVDGDDLRQISRASLRAQVGVVFQEALLFNSTVRENIRLGRPEATDQEVEAAARAAEVHDFVRELPNGYDTLVGERGGLLSAGQRQRLAIARAIVRDPSILLLDEATASLDPEAETRINATLDRLAAGRTLIAATHRLSSAARADRILVLQRGSIVEDGTHDELIRKMGVYYRLWQQQRGFVVSAGGLRAEVEAARLRAIPLFAELDRPHLAAIAQRFVTERFNEGRRVFEEGDPGDKLYVIVHGSVEVLKGEAAGEARRLAVLQDGDFFGEIALLQDVPRTATIVTRTPCLLLTLSRQHFEEVLAASPELRAAFERVATMRRGEQTGAVRPGPG